MLGIGLLHHLKGEYKNFYHANGNRSTSGTEVITIGFKPVISIVTARDVTTSNINLSWGVVFHNVFPTEQHVMFMGDNGAYVDDSNNLCIKVRRTSVNYLQGAFNTQTATGFSITWTLTGVASLYWDAMIIG